MFSWSWDSSFWRFVTEVESSFVSTGGVEGREEYVFGGLAIAFELFRGRSFSSWEVMIALEENRSTIRHSLFRSEILVNVNIITLYYETLIAVPVRCPVQLFRPYKRDFIAMTAALHTTHKASDPHAPRLRKRWGTSLRSGSSMNGSLEATPMSGIEGKSTREATEKSMRYFKTLPGLANLFTADRRLFIQGIKLVLNR
jgi:hypothetical protein